MQDPATSEIWMHAFGKDFGHMAQGNTKTGTTGTDAIFVMEPILNIPKDQPPTYAKVVLSLLIVCKRKTCIDIESQQEEI